MNEFCWCNWDCWAAWLNSSVGAAWGQAFFTLLAIALSVGVSLALHGAQIKEARRKAEAEQLLEYHKNMARAKVVMKRIKSGADYIRSQIRAGLSDRPPIYRLALNEKLEALRDDMADLRRIMLSDLPNPTVINLVNHGVVIGEDFKAHISDCLSYKPPMADLKELNYVSQRMQKLHDHIQDYHVNTYMHDPGANPGDFVDLKRGEEYHAPS
ncbi:MAG: hypothetical protein KAG70_10300 [Alcanivorax sp.]|nr:hypothetical protein [Alcanivorax sp.]